MPDDEDIYEEVDDFSFEIERNEDDHITDIYLDVDDVKEFITEYNLDDIIESYSNFSESLDLKYVDYSPLEVDANISVQEEDKSFFMNKSIPHRLKQQIYQARYELTYAELGELSSSTNNPTASQEQNIYFVPEGSINKEEHHYEEIGKLNIGGVATEEKKLKDEIKSFLEENEFEWRNAGMPDLFYKKFPRISEKLVDQINAEMSQYVYAHQSEGKLFLSVRFKNFEEGPFNIEDFQSRFKRIISSDYEIDSLLDELVSATEDKNKTIREEQPQQEPKQQTEKILGIMPASDLSDSEEPQGNLIYADLDNRAEQSTVNDKSVLIESSQNNEEKTIYSELLPNMRPRSDAISSAESKTKIGAEEKNRSDSISEKMKKIFLKNDVLGKKKNSILPSNKNKVSEKNRLKEVKKLFADRKSGFLSKISESYSIRKKSDKHGIDFKVKNKKDPSDTATIKVNEEKSKEINITLESSPDNNSAMELAILAFIKSHGDNWESFQKGEQMPEKNGEPLKLYLNGGDDYDESYAEKIKEIAESKFNLKVSTMKDQSMLAEKMQDQLDEHKDELNEQLTSLLPPSSPK